MDRGGHQGVDHHGVVLLAAGKEGGSGMMMCISIYLFIFKKKNPPFHHDRYSTKRVVHSYCMYIYIYIPNVK